MDSGTYQGNFGRFWSSKKFNGFDLLLVGLGGSTLIKTIKWTEQEFYARARAKLPRILFRREKGNLGEAKLGLIKWQKYNTRKTLARKLQVRPSLTLRLAAYAFLEREFYDTPRSLQTNRSEKCRLTKLVNFGHF